MSHQCTCGHVPRIHGDANCRGDFLRCKCNEYTDAEAATLRARVAEMEKDLERETLGADMWMIRASAHEARVAELEEELRATNAEQDADEKHLAARIAQLTEALREIADHDGCSSSYGPGCDGACRSMPWTAEQALGGKP